MANMIFDAGRAAFAKAEINWLTADIRAILVDTALYTYSVAHPFLSSIAAGARVGSAVALATKTVASNGALGAANTVFSSVSGATVEAAVLYLHTGVEATSTLILWVDTVTGLPFTPTGLSVTLTWNTGTNGIFRL